MRSLRGHLGSQVASLVDGQLDPVDSERAWDHALRCPTCRNAVEQELWVKNRLAGMARAEPPTHLPHVLSGLDGEPLYDRSADAWSTVAALERRHRARRAGLAAVGAGSASLALIGLGALGGLLDPPNPARGETSIGGSVTPAPVAPLPVVDHVVPAERRHATEDGGIRRLGTATPDQGR